MKNHYLAAAILPFALTFRGLAPQAIAQQQAGHAIIVGVNRYPSTQAGALAGPVNDADSFADSCRTRGYTVTLLEDGTATKAQILQAIRSAPVSPLVFYYSGYGSGPAEAALLCSDTQEKGPRLAGTLTLRELDQALLTCPAREKTVILDACFTAPRASKDGPSEGVVRYYKARGEASSRGVMLASAQQIPHVSHDKIQYICASRYNEEALEGDYQGKPMGLFSATLCKTLADYPALTWQAAQVQVSSKLSLLADDRQHPVFPPACLAKAALARKETLANNSSSLPLAGNFPLAQGGPPVATAWEAFGMDVPDPTIVRVSIFPDQDVFVVGKSLGLKISVGKPGYLVVINQGSEGGFNVLYPREGQPLRVGGGQAVQIPEQGVDLTPDRPGKERVKAFLFASADKAEEFLQAARPAAGARLDQAAVKLGARSLVFGGAIEEGRAPVLTSDLSFEVVPHAR